MALRSDRSSEPANPPRTAREKESSLKHREPGVGESAGILLLNRTSFLDVELRCLYPRNDGLAGGSFVNLITHTHCLHSHQTLVHSPSRRLPRAKGWFSSIANTGSIRSWPYHLQYEIPIQVDDLSIMYRVAVAPSRQLPERSSSAWRRSFEEGPVIQVVHCPCSRNASSAIWPSAPYQSSVVSSSCSAPFKAIRSRLPPTKPVVLKSGATSMLRVKLMTLGLPGMRNDTRTLPQKLGETDAGQAVARTMAIAAIGYLAAKRSEATAACLSFLPTRRKT
jgi:hypothetical protein